MEWYHLKIFLHTGKLCFGHRGGLLCFVYFFPQLKIENCVTFSDTTCITAILGILDALISLLYWWGHVQWFTFTCYFSNWLLQFIVIWTNCQRHAETTKGTEQSCQTGLQSKLQRTYHPLLRELQWFPVCERIKDKLLLLAYKSKHETTPPNIQNLLEPYNYSDGTCFFIHMLMIIFVLVIQPWQLTPHTGTTPSARFFAKGFVHVKGLC